jgi:hypothetical protein
VFSLVSQLSQKLYVKRNSRALNLIEEECLSRGGVVLLLALRRVDQVEESVDFGVQQQQETHVFKALWNQRPACLRTVYSGNEGWLRRRLLSFALHLCTKLKNCFHDYIDS